MHAAGVCNIQWACTQRTPYTKKYGSPIRLIDLIRQVARTSAGQEPSRDTSTAPLYDWPAAEAAPA